MGRQKSRMGTNILRSLATDARFFYVPNMHGVDWEKIKNKYEVLLPYVANKHDLNYIIGEMVGELSVGHLI